MALDKNTVAVGTELPTLTKPAITRETLKVYGPAAGDPNPMHVDDEFAKNAGYPGVFAHGMLSMGFVAQSVTDWVGAGRVRKISVRFAALVRLGDVITCHGRVTGRRAPQGAQDGQVDLELWAENQKGEKVVTGRATVTLRSRG